MELDWSAQSPHIRTLFRPWQPGDGYDEATIQAAEERLGIRLPATLRNFYLAWGKRRDLTEQVDYLLHPDQLEMREDTFLFAAENQAVWYGGVPCEALEEADPPVVVGNPDEWLEVMKSGMIWRQSHAHLSGFLDDLTYLHAFCGGAIHGGYTQPTSPPLPAHHIAWLEENWSKAAATPMAFQMVPDPTMKKWPTLYVRDGQAFWTFGPCSLAARDAEAVDEIAQRFQITWATRW